MAKFIIVYIFYHCFVPGTSIEIVVIKSVENRTMLHGGVYRNDIEVIRFRIK